MSYLPYVLAAVVFVSYGSILLVAFVFLNSGYQQGTTGQSIGKWALGVKLVGATTGQPVGFALAIGRLLAHVIDVIPFCIGFLLPLWDEQRRTFADRICSTLVVRIDAEGAGPPRDV